MTERLRNRIQLLTNILDIVLRNTPVVIDDPHDRKQLEQYKKQLARTANVAVDPHNLGGGRYEDEFDDDFDDFDDFDEEKVKTLRAERLAKTEHNRNNPSSKEKDTQ